MNLYELDKKFKIARKRSYIFNQIQKITLKIYFNLSYIERQYHLKLQIPIMHRHFFKILSQNPDYIETFCNDMKDLFHLNVVNGILTTHQTKNCS